MNNIKLLDLCRKNLERFFDPYYMFVEKDQNLSTYAKDTKRIKHLLITIKEMSARKVDRKLLDGLYKDLQELIKKHRTNYSEFGCFVNACDSNIGEVKVDLELLINITKLYLQKRELNEIVPSEWIQAILDKSSSRKKGHAGTKKLIDILVAKGYLKSNSPDDFLKNTFSFAKISSKGKFGNKVLKKLFKIDFGKGKQGKILDLVIKKNQQILFLEAKHLNTGGGEQNKQVLELIDLIKIRLSNPNLHIVAFLDGVYFNEIFCKVVKSEEGKVIIQKNDIIKWLKANPNNYFINTYGFKKLF